MLSQSPLIEKILAREVEATQLIENLNPNEDVILESFNQHYQTPIRKLIDKFLAENEINNADPIFFRLQHLTDEEKIILKKDINFIRDIDKSKLTPPQIFLLGCSYFYAIDNCRSYKKAEFYFKRIPKISAALDYLGQIANYYGDVNKARKYFIQVPNPHNLDAIVHLADTYCNEKDPKLKKLAYNYYNFAAKKNNPAACNRLSRYFSDLNHTAQPSDQFLKNMQLSIFFAFKAAVLGDPCGLGQMGCAYASGSTHAHIYQAYKYFLNAAERGDAYAFYNLGTHERFLGKGYESFHSAIFCFRRSFEIGYVKAKEMLQMISNEHTQDMVIIFHTLLALHRKKDKYLVRELEKLVLQDFNLFMKLCDEEPPENIPKILSLFSDEFRYKLAAHIAAVRKALTQADVTGERPPLPNEIALTMMEKFLGKNLAHSFFYNRCLQKEITSEKTAQIILHKIEKKLTLAHPYRLFFWRNPKEIDLPLKKGTVSLSIAEAENVIQQAHSQQQSYTHSLNDIRNLYVRKS